MPLMNKLTHEQRVQAVSCLIEGCSIRTGAPHHLILKGPGVDASVSAGSVLQPIFLRLQIGAKASLQTAPHRSPTNYL